ncbi:CBS domain-containing protein [Pseudonocardia xishanensis]|uniref:CBS domain-containing protein n=2 Tax=Pseudonocardia xishanensis TaxID=630995 RepID=A0ABP8RLY1_9PSEU
MTAMIDSIRPDDSVVRLMRTPVASVATGWSVRDVAEELMADEVGALLVDGAHGPVGILSERDVVVLVATGGDPDTVQARDIMTTELEWAEVEETIRRVSSRMRAAGIRHMPVRGVDGKPVGIVSARDVLTVITDEPR